MSYDIDPNVDPFEYHPNTRRSLGVIENQAVTTESGRERMNRLQQKTPGWNEPGGSSGEHKPITGLQSSPAQTPMAPQFRSQYTSGQVSYPNPNRSGSANMTYSGKRPTASGSELSLPRSYADVALRTQTVTGYELAMEFAGVQDQRRNNDVSNPHTEAIAKETPPEIMRRSQTSMHSRTDKSNRSHQVNSQWAKPELQKDQEFLTAQTQPRFSGEPGEDAADFVGNIQRIAFAQGRQRDDEWQADYAATCLAGPAMRWYCDLEDDKRMAWSNLRRSLLQHFPPLPLPTAPPAAPPPAAVSGHLSKPPRSKASVGPARNTEILSQTAGETTATSRGGTQAPLSRHTIRFYEITNPFYGFTNSSPHEVRFDGKMYPTSEHLFQSLKFIEHKPLLAERIRTIGKQPEMARSEAHRFFSEVREDWRDVSITMMEMVVLHKFDQHPALKVELFATGDAELVLDSGSEDAFWGNGADGKGRNEFGKALMRLRTHLRTNGRNQR